MDNDDVFKALADPSRRTLLDQLFQTDGQTLSALEACLPMSRFGVMKHLNVLEEAGLITTRKVGREKLHYLNSVPIQLVYERWVSKYAQPFAGRLTELKYTLEDSPVADKPSHVFEVYIRTTPERLWQALTDPAFTRQYYFGTAVQSDWKPGAAYRYLYPSGETMIAGTVLESDPPRRLVTTFQPMWTDDAQPITTVTCDVVVMGATCKLTVTHADLESNAMTQGLTSGWQQILSGLKTLLETGEPLIITS